MEFDMMPTFVFISCYFCIMCVMNFSKNCHPPKLTPRACRTVKVSDHDSIIRKRLGKNGTDERLPGQKPLLNKKDTKIRLTFANKKHSFPSQIPEIFVD